MKNDLVSIFINLSESLPSVQSMVSGFGYIVGIGLMIKGFLKLKESAGQSHESIVSTMVYFFAGALLIFLPTAIDAFSNTFFGSDNILGYDTTSEDPFYYAIFLLIRTAGVVWFVRGCVLLLRTGKPGIKDSNRSLLYIFAGIMAINIETTIQAIDYSLNLFMNVSDGK